jgi:hypothetical protein
MVLSVEDAYGDSGRWGTRKLELEREIAEEEEHIARIRRAVDPQGSTPIELPNKIALGRFMVSSTSFLR